MIPAPTSPVDQAPAASTSVQTSAADGSFDYAGFPADLRDQAMLAGARIRSLVRASIIDVGNELISIKARLPHGEFGKWVKAECNFTERSAQNYMMAAEMAGKHETVSVFPPITLYLLASPSTPEPARQNVIDRLNRGETISNSDLRSLIRDAQWEQRQEERKAAKAATLAKLSPRARRSRATREAEFAAQTEARRRCRDAVTNAARQTAELILSKVDHEVLRSQLQYQDIEQYLGAELRRLLGIRT